MNCVNCDAALQEVFEGSAKRFQFRDALDIQIHLGYGEFQDSGPEQNPSPRANFCSDCSTKLVETFPGIYNMIHGIKQ